MLYISLETLTEARNHVEKNVTKPETFAGLILFFLCVSKSERNGTYLKSDMKKFSEYADKAFCLSLDESPYLEQSWYALLTHDWTVQVKNSYLGNEKLSLKKLMYSLFWYEPKYKMDEILEIIPEDIIDQLFIRDLDPDDFINITPITKQDLKNHYSSQDVLITLKFDSSLIKKRAGDLTGAPFAQTLYASNGIKKIISVYSFNFMEVYNLYEEKVETQKLVNDSNSQSLSKPFLLLAGISGTGKTRFVRKQVENNKDSSIGENYCLTSVRPDWHEPSDILGYISRLGGDGNAEYITTDVLQFIAKAWRAIIDTGLELEPKGNGLAITGNKSELEQVLPYWLCLDEMNLAPVEQYFADYLSVLETREWQWDNEQFTYCCDSLLKSATIKQLKNKSKLRNALDFADERYDDAWDLFCEYGLGLPFNLIVAGTVNMDETTHGFSRKVIDRALSFDFGDFFPNEFDDFFEPKVTHNALSYPIWSHASKADVDFEVDSEDGEKINSGTATVSFLNEVNSVLKNTPFELAFRALNELLLAVISSQPKDDLALKAVWDDFMMCKVLPRIEGDTDKLTTSDGKALLTELNTVLAKQLAPIWQAEQGDKNQRPDLYREKVTAEDATDEAKVLHIPCRSKAKLKWMSDCLASATFTSFWP